MTDMFRFADDIGPEKVVHVHEPSTGLRGIVVIDNVAAGPSIGGVRMATDVTTEECFRLARAMTFKNAAAGLRHGGGKSVVVADPTMPSDEKEGLVRAFAQAIEPLEDYIIGPDMGTNETCMAWVHDEIGRAVGLPRELGGIPLDEIGATGWGLAASVEVATEFCDLRLDGARVAVQGFGAVGIHAARFLVDRGAVLVAAADSRGTVHDPRGIDVAALVEAKRAGHGVAASGLGSGADSEAILDVECDVWIPAARPDVLRQDNVDRLRARVVAQGANIPATPAAERELHERGVLVLPDFIANAGGVICAAVEWSGGTEDQAMATIDERVRRNTYEVLDRARAAAAPPRHAADALSEDRVRRASGYRRRF